MTKILRRRKIVSWESAKEKVFEILANIPEQTSSLTLPYGLQCLYNISHPEAVRILLHPTMNNYDTFVAHHGKAKKYFLNIWTVNQKDCYAKKKQLKVKLDYKLKHLVYVPAHRCLVAFANDLTLRVFATMSFIEVSRADTNDSVLCLYYNACRDDILAGCCGFVMIWKFSHAQTDPMFPVQKIECLAILSDYWVTWIKVDKYSKQLLLNCQEAIVMLDEETYKLKCDFKIELRHELSFTSCAFYHPSCYFITGSKDSAIKVWNTSLSHFPLMTKLLGHCNAVTALEVDIAHHLVISSSTDKTIRLWCLETFAQIYRLETGEEIHHMEMMTSQRLFYHSHEHVRVWNLNQFHSLFTVLGCEIMTSRRVVSRGCPARLVFHCEDGTIRIVSPCDGTIVTTMFPLGSLSETIVDYSYNPREDRLYLVLSTGSILVFNTKTNPCSAYQLWKCDIVSGREDSSSCSPEYHGVNCLTMMNIEGQGDTHKFHHTLLFAGLNNGHILLVDSNGLTMPDLLEAHYGRIALLGASDSLDLSGTQTSALLVSCGTDCELKAWKVNLDQAAKIISLDLCSMVKLTSVPSDMELIGDIIGLVMDNNIFMTYWMNTEHELPARCPHTGRDFPSKHDFNVKCFTSVAEEKHSKSISGLSSCVTLGLFATASDDWSVKIWSSEAKLVKELCFEESLRGVCFANARGDLLVGFQSHISVIALTNYLPLKSLEILSKMKFLDDVFEDHMPFDRTLPIFYDPQRVPWLPLDLEQRRQMVLQEQSWAKPPKTPLSKPLLLENSSEGSQCEEFNATLRRYSISQEQDQLDEKLRKFDRLSVSRRSSAPLSPFINEVFSKIKQSLSSYSENTAVNEQSQDLMFQLQKLFDCDDYKIPENYWLCAPDGYIPNSIVRQKVRSNEMPLNLMPRLLRGEELKTWMKKTKKKIVAVTSPEQYEHSVNFEEEDLGITSIFEDFDKHAWADGLKRILSDDESDDVSVAEHSDEELGSSDEEIFLPKRWKASSKAPRNIAAPVDLMSLKPPIAKSKLTKEPEMAVVLSTEENNERFINASSSSDRPKTDENEKMMQATIEKTEKGSATRNVEEVDPSLSLPAALRFIYSQSWFPDLSLTGGENIDDIVNQMIVSMAASTPSAYAMICDALLGLISSVGISEDQRSKLLHVVLNNLIPPFDTTRCAYSLKALQELGCTSNEAVQGIITCVVHGTEEIQQLALKTLEELLGVKDKEGLRNLLISFNFLSRSPSPECSLERLKTTEIGHSRVKTEPEMSYKDKYIHEWLEASTGCDLPKRKLKPSILRKLKLYKKHDPHLSIIDLTFDDSSSSTSQARSDLDEMESAKRKRTREHSPTPLDNQQLMYIDIAEGYDMYAQKWQRPPSVVMGRAYGKSNRTIFPSITSQDENADDISEPDEEGRELRDYRSIYKLEGNDIWPNYESAVHPRQKSQDRRRDSEKYWSEVKGQDQERDSKKYWLQECEKQTHLDRGRYSAMSEAVLQGKGRFPRIFVSTSPRKVRSESEKSEEHRVGTEKETEKLLLPKIFQRIKSYQHKAICYQQDVRNVRNKVLGTSARVGQVGKEHLLKLPDLDFRQQEWKTRMPTHPDLPHDRTALTYVAREKVDMKRLAITERHSVDCTRRKSPLRRLRRERLEKEKQIAEKFLSNQEASSMMTSLEEANMDRRFSPGFRFSSGVTARVRLPTIDDGLKLVERRRVSSAKDDITQNMLTGDMNQHVISNYTTPFGSRSENITQYVLSDDIMRRLSPADINRSGVSRNVDRDVTSNTSGRHEPSDDIAGGMFSADATRVIPGTSIPLSLYIDVIGERLSRGTSVKARGSEGDLGISSGSLRVLPVDPKLTIHTGRYKRGSSRYGILEVQWTSRGIYETQDLGGSRVASLRQAEHQDIEQKHARVSKRPIHLRKYLKPIRNHNLVTNPFTSNLDHYFTKRERRKFSPLPEISEDGPSVSEHVPVIAPKPSISSLMKRSEAKQSCTIRELMHAERFNRFS